MTIQSRSARISDAQGKTRRRSDRNELHGFSGQGKPHSPSCQGELRYGAGDALSQAFEMVATPAVFGLGGWWADERLDIFPLLTLTAVILVFSYQMWRVAQNYAMRMDRALEKRRSDYGQPMLRPPADRHCQIRLAVTEAAAADDTISKTS